MFERVPTALCIIFHILLLKLQTTADYMLYFKFIGWLGQCTPFTQGQLKDPKAFFFKTNRNFLFSLFLIWQVVWHGIFIAIDILHDFSFLYRATRSPDQVSPVSTVSDSPTPQFTEESNRKVHGANNFANFSWENLISLFHKKRQRRVAIYIASDIASIYCASSPGTVGLPPSYRKTRFQRKN